MGSCFSTEDKDDVTFARKERHRQLTPHSYGREDTTPIFINPKGARNGFELDQQTSYTDKAMLEQDLFRQIVSKTARNLIDISSQLTPVLEQERIILQKLYSAKTHEVQCNTSALFSLPVPSSSNTLDLLSAPNPIEEHQQLIDECTQLARAWADTKEVRDCGRVVIPFDEFSAQ